MSNLKDHAIRELQLAGYYDEEEDGGFGKMVREDVLALLDVFCEQGHSGGSAPIIANLFRDLALYKLLTPLTGKDDEWCEVSEGVFQNKRCHHVFRQPDRFEGQAYDIEGKIFREPSGACFTSSDSFVPITFPYTPKPEYVDVPASEGEAK